ncbi:hypothetical protein IFM47457_01776 [Aspergillus lentulus]|nr:hypothetical protein IFM47457_01776 [Aspergillus lentulus]
MHTRGEEAEVGYLNCAYGKGPWRACVRAEIVSIESKGTWVLDYTLCCDLGPENEEGFFVQCHRETTQRYRASVA